jgi:hypothetical protein
MIPYVTKNRTQSVSESTKIIDSIHHKINGSSALADLAQRIRTGPKDGMPSKAPRAPRVNHSAEALTSEVIG